MHSFICPFLRPYAHWAWIPEHVCSHRAPVSALVAQCSRTDTPRHYATALPPSQQSCPCFKWVKQEKLDKPQKLSQQNRSHQAWTDTSTAPLWKYQYRKTMYIFCFIKMPGFIMTQIPNDIKQTFVWFVHAFSNQPMDSSIGFHNCAHKWHRFQFFFICK